MSNDSNSKFIGIGSIKVRMFDGVVRTLNNANYVPKLRKTLIYLGLWTIWAMIFLQ